MITSIISNSLFYGISTSYGCAFYITSSAYDLEVYDLFIINCTATSSVNYEGNIMSCPAFFIASSQSFSCKRICCNNLDGLKWSECAVFLSTKTIYFNETSLSNSHSSGYSVLLSSENMVSYSINFTYVSADTDKTTLHCGYSPYY